MSIALTKKLTFEPRVWAESFDPDRITLFETATGTDSRTDDDVKEVA